MPTTGHPKLTLIREVAQHEAAQIYGGWGQQGLLTAQRCSPRASPPGTQQGGEPGPGGRSDRPGWSQGSEVAHPGGAMGLAGGQHSEERGVCARMPSLQVLGAGFQIRPCLHSVISVSCRSPGSLTSETGVRITAPPWKALGRRRSVLHSKHPS